MKRFALLFLLGLATTASASAGSWKLLGPWAGGVHALAGDPSDPAILYAGTQAGGVFKTTDGGASWSLVGPTLPRSSVEAIAVDPSDPKRVYAGTYDKGVYRSTDSGATWKV